MKILQGGTDLHKQHYKHDAVCKAAPQREAPVSSREQQKLLMARLKAD